MSSSTLDRLAPLSGVLAVVGLLASAVLFRVSDYLPSGEHLVAAFSANPGAVAGGGYVGNLSAVLMLAFAGCATIQLRRADPSGGWLVKLGFAGAAGAAIILGIGSSLIIAIGSRAGSAGGLDPVEALALYDAYGNLMGGVLAVAVAALMFAGSVIWLRVGVLPLLVQLGGIAVAVLLLTPIAYLILLPALAWIVVVSVWMSRQEPSAG